MRALPGRASRTSLPEPPPGLTRESAAEAQRARIRRATGELIAKRGYAGVTVELIVKRARVSFKTFYKHYANKDEAFCDLFDVAFARTREQVDAAFGDGSLPWPERVGRAMRAFFEAIVAEPLIARACLVEAPTAGPVMLERYEQATQAFVPLLRAGREYNPEARELPATLEDTLAGSVLWSAYQRLILGEVDRIEALLPETIELVLRPYIGEAAAREAVAAVAAG